MKLLPNKVWKVVICPSFEGYKSNVEVLVIVISLCKTLEVYIDE